MAWKLTGFKIDIVGNGVRKEEEVVVPMADEVAPEVLPTKKTTKKKTAKKDEAEAVVAEEVKPEETETIVEETPVVEEAAKEE
ncbi:TPA: hypothetical protein DCP42_01235 [Patescibacteria group bacterium]|nr:hypothetical protein [Patescibacteria group bacterium]